MKGALAWSTVSQMAFMVVQCSVGAFSSATFHIAGHGMYKAALFLGAGDTVSGTLRSRRRPSPARAASPSAIWAATLLMPTVAVGIAVERRPDVSEAGQVLIVVFAWLSAAFALHGWLVSRTPQPAAIGAHGHPGRGGGRWCLRGRPADVEALVEDRALDGNHGDDHRPRGARGNDCGGGGGRGRPRSASRLDRRSSPHCRTEGRRCVGHAGSEVGHDHRRAHDQRCDVGRPTAGRGSAICRRRRR